MLPGIFMARRRELESGPPDGVVFDLSPGSRGSWKERVLHTFGKYSGDGQVPSGPIVFDGASTLDTTTAGGGKNLCGPQGDQTTCGTVVQLRRRPDGRWGEHIIHNFASGLGGFYPNGGVILDTVGNLYGTTFVGGLCRDIASSDATHFMRCYAN